MKRLATILAMLLINSGALLAQSDYLEQADNTFLCTEENIYPDAQACSVPYEVNGTAPPNIGLYRGGSNFNWYNVVSCDREPYGVIVNYHTHTSEIRARLSSMRSAGQARLRLMIHHGNGLSSGTLLNSAGGTLSAQNLSNLQNLVSDFRTYGFGEIQISFGPQGPNDPAGWSSMNNAMAEENWRIINQVHQLLQNSGMLIKYDLGNELMTTSTSNPRYKYMRYIWTRYYPLYGHLADTVGFSFAPGQISAISNMDSIYGSNSYPAMVDVHIYPTGGSSAGDLVRNVANKLRSIGPYPGQYRWIIGEANFNNLTDAQSMRVAIQGLSSTQSKPFFLLQWPIIPNSPDCFVADVSPFNNYIANGF